MVDHPADYPRFSYQINRQGKSSELITPHHEYIRIDRNKGERRKQYRSLFNVYMEPELINEILQSTNGNTY